MKERKLTKQQITVLIGACLYQCALVGTLVNSNGTIMTQIRISEGLSMTMISANSSVRSIVGAITAGFLTTLFYRVDKWKAMLASVFVVASGYLLLIIGTDNWLWYAAPALCCPVASIGVIAVPYILQLWFPQSSGTVTGIAMAFSGIGGMIFNPVTASLIEACGWQKAITVLSVLMIGMAAVGVLLIFSQRQPMPDGRQEKAPKEMTLPSECPGLKIGARFFLCCITILSGGICTVVVSYINLHMVSIGYSLYEGAAIMSFVMAGNISGKLLFGSLSDKIGIWKACVVANSLMAIGAILFVSVQNSLPVLCAAAFVFGMSYFIAAVAVPRCSLSAYGTVLNKKYIGFHTTINSAVAAVAAFFAGRAFDMLGDFSMVFIIAAILCLCSMTAAAIMAFYYTANCRRGALVRNV